MAEGTADRKPWFCTTCSDRFATQRAPQHEYIWSPRDKPEEDMRLLMRPAVEDTGEPGFVGLTKSGKLVVHGGNGTGYRSHGCRCRKCTDANTRVQSANQAKRHESEIPGWVPHGTASTYNNWGCRCDGCSIAKRRRNADDYARRKKDNT